MTVLLWYLLRGSVELSMTSKEVTGTGWGGLGGAQPRALPWTAVRSRSTSHGPAPQGADAKARAARAAGSAWRPALLSSLQFPGQNECKTTMTCDLQQGTSPLRASVSSSVKS